MYKADWEQSRLSHYHTQSYAKMKESNSCLWNDDFSLDLYSRKLYYHLLWTILPLCFCINTFLLIVAGRKNRYQHSLTEKLGLFDKIDNGESSDPSFCIFESEEEPVIVTVSIEIVLDKQIKLLVLLSSDVGSAKISAFEIGVYSIL